MAFNYIPALFFVRDEFNFQRYCTQFLPDVTASFHGSYHYAGNKTAGYG